MSLGKTYYPPDERPKRTYGLPLFVGLVVFFAILFLWAMLDNEDLYGKLSAPTPQPTPRETPWLWPLPSGDGQFCIVLDNQLGTCFSVTEGP